MQRIKMYEKYIFVNYIIYYMIVNAIIVLKT